MTGTKKAKVLAVDDEEDVTELVAFHLRAKGYEVEALNDPNKVLSRSKDFQPDVLILDVMMPDLSGIQICRLLRADKAFAEVPVLFLTARAGENDRVTGLEVGADDYVCKPFSPRELVLRVQSLLRRSQNGTKGRPEPTTLKVGPISVDVERHEVRISG